MRTKRKDDLDSLVASISPNAGWDEAIHTRLYFSRLILMVATLVHAAVEPSRVSCRWEVGATFYCHSPS